MLNNRTLVQNEETKLFFYRGEKDDIVFILSILNSGKYECNMFIIDGEDLNNELTRIVATLTSASTRRIATMEEYVYYKNKEQYRITFYEGNQTDESRISKIERPHGLRVSADRRSYSDDFGNTHVFTKVTARNRTWLEYFKLDRNVIKYTLDGYLNALQRNNTREREALRVEFISDNEFFTSELQKKVFRVNG